MVVDCVKRTRFLLNAYNQKHNTNYRSIAPLGFYKYQDSSGAASCYKLKDDTEVQSIIPYALMNLEPIRLLLIANLDLGTTFRDEYPDN